LRAGWLAYDLACWKSKTAGKPHEAWNAFQKRLRLCSPHHPSRTRRPACSRTAALLGWAHVKFSFIARGAGEHWDVNFFLSDVLEHLEKRDQELTAGGV
jgi:hypothetical protein